MLLKILIDKCLRYDLYLFCSPVLGRVGITLNCDWWQPLNADDPADWQAAERAMQFHCAWFKHPIFVSGDYPDVMKEYVGRYSAAQGLNESRLPAFTEEQKIMIKGNVVKSDHGLLCYYYMFSLQFF